MAEQDVALMAHLLRRAGFGASRDEIEAKAAQGYDKTLEELLNPESQPDIEEDLLFRLHPALYEGGAIESGVHDFVYRMINSPRQLQEKTTLFWHTIFCAGHSKIDHGLEMARMIAMFREHGMGNFRDLLYRLSTNPGMLYYLDNTESHKVALNENYGRELLELFSLGVGMDEEFNYTEDDVKACARAFTGWNVAPAFPLYPYARGPWEFRFDPADHDDGEKTFLGETGRWNGDDILDIICKQPATARFRLPAHVQLLRGRRATGASMASDSTAGYGSAKNHGESLLRLRVRHYSHVAGDVHLRVLQVRVSKIRQG